MEFTVWCRLCGHSEAWTTVEASQAAGVWHVHDEHPAEWMAALGTQGEGYRLPKDPRPQLLGRRFESWERQS